MDTGPCCHDAISKATVFIRQNGRRWVVESFFGTLNSERVFWQNYQTCQQERNDIVDYIAMFYNPLRLHSYLDYKSPNQYEWMAQWAKVA